MDQPMASSPHVRRFDAFDRTLHALMMVSFLGLAGTGLPLRFSDTVWARRIVAFLGSFEVAGWLHRVSALLLFFVFFTHVTRIGRRIFVKGETGLLWGSKSMVPGPKDLADMFGHMKWFVGLGPRPKFDRWTYWEKFDYWAVFWGMAIIGGSGLMLWFPEFFARFMPGSLFNIAMVVHGEEALLAVGFIFTIHFYNTHIRPEKFPVDTVIFTGSVPVEELQEERPAEYARLVKTGKLDALRVDPPQPWLFRLAFVVAAIAVPIGLILVGLIIYTELA